MQGNEGERRAKEMKNSNAAVNVGCAFGAAPDIVDLSQDTSTNASVIEHVQLPSMGVRETTQTIKRMRAELSRIERESHCSIKLFQKSNKKYFTVSSTSKERVVKGVRLLQEKMFDAVPRSNPKKRACLEMTNRTKRIKTLDTMDMRMDRIERLWSAPDRLVDCFARLKALVTDDRTSLGVQTDPKPECCDQAVQASLETTIVIHRVDSKWLIASPTFDSIKFIGELFGLSDVNPDTLTWEPALVCYSIPDTQLSLVLAILAKANVAVQLEAKN